MDGGGGTRIVVLLYVGGGVYYIAYITYIRSQRGDTEVKVGVAMNR